MNKLILTKALEKLARRNYCSFELIYKLKQKYPEDKSAIEEVVGFLVSRKYIDDRDYVSRYIEYCLREKNYGFNKAKNKLRLKRVPSKFIDEVVGVENVDESEFARKYIEKKLKNRLISEIEDKERMKIIRSALNRGFKYEDIKKAMRKSS